MDIKQAKEALRRTYLVYTERDEFGSLRIPAEQQRPLLLMGPPGVGKTAILSQLAEELGAGLVAYTMTHHTRQSAFEGSRRQKRAELVRIVLAAGPEGIDAGDAGALLNETERRAGRDGVGDEEIASIIDDLASEGFFKRVGGQLVS